MRNIAKHVSQMVALLAVLIFSTVSAFAMPTGEVNWQDGFITVTGSGAAPANGSPAQKRMMAKRAAIADGYRQLVETVKGVNVDAETTVENFITSSDVIRTKVSGMVQGARVISEKFTPDGGYEVTMQAPLFGVSNSLASAVMPRPETKEVFPEPVASVAPSMPAYDASASVSVRVEVTANASASEAPAPAPTSNAIGNYTGIIVDCRGLGLQPVMSPVIMNQNGEKIYGHRNLDPDYVISNGMASYTTDLNSGCKRAGNNPLVVKAVALQSHNSYPVLSVADANRVLIENKATGFLEKTNVVFIR